MGNAFTKQLIINIRAYVIGNWLINGKQCQVHYFFKWHKLNCIKAILPPSCSLHGEENTLSLPHLKWLIAWSNQKLIDFQSQCWESVAEVPRLEPWCSDVITPGSTNQNMMLLQNTKQNNTKKKAFLLCTSRALSKHHCFIVLPILHHNDVVMPGSFPNPNKIQRRENSTSRQLFTT